MAPHRPRVREGWRRLAAGLVLLLVAGVAVNEDVQGLPDARRGSRPASFDLPHLGSTPVHIPLSSPTGVVLLLHAGASSREHQPLVDAVPWHVLLIDVDVRRLGSSPANCAALADQLEDISRRAQRDAGITPYRPPVLVVASSALAVAASALSGSFRTALPAAVALGVSTEGPPPPRCAGSRPSDRPIHDDGQLGRWYTPRDTDMLAPLVEHAVTMAAATPAPDATPVQRWLRHFDLPLTAAWSSAPRAMLVLLSPARGWRATDEALAQQLSESGVHVIGIDALQSFWQRRSPRDVAHQLQRLTDALATTGLPIHIGGREFGAETMVVAAEMMASNRHVAGVVLVDPGPAAFFEVEPPALALRPFGPSEWSTRAAVSGLGRPTLCVTHDPNSSSGLLCSSLARRGQAIPASTAADASALADTIGRFVLRRGAAR